MPQLVPRHNWSPGPSAANYVAVDGPLGPSMAAMDGPLCRKWSPVASRKTVAAATNRPIYILIDEFEVTIKIFRNNAMHVCCNSESILAAKTMHFFFLYSFANRDLGHNWLSSDSVRCCHRGSNGIAIAIPCI